MPKHIPLCRTNVTLFPGSRVNQLLRVGLAPLHMACARYFSFTLHGCTIRLFQIQLVGSRKETARDSAPFWGLIQQTISGAKPAGIPRRKGLAWTRESTTARGVADTGLEHGVFWEFFSSRKKGLDKSQKKEYHQGDSRWIRFQVHPLPKSRLVQQVALF